MDLSAFLRLAKEFSDLGDAVGDQLIAVANGAPIEDQNPNALRMCHRLLKQLDGYEVDGAVELQNEIFAAAKSAQPA